MDNSTILSLPTYQLISNSQLLVHIFAVIFPLTFCSFDVLLLTATISNRRDTAIPVAYIVVMCFRGMISSFILVLQGFMYLVLTADGYQVFLSWVGKETTLLGSFTYLIALLISVLMSINRVSVVVKPFNNWFTHTRIFIYCGIVSIGLFISLVIPYMSSCYVVFMMDRKAFVSGCAPARHPITTFQNTYTIVLPFFCMLVNLSIIMHLRFIHNNFYTIFCHKVRGSVQSENSFQSIFISKQRAKRDIMMIRQTITIAVYLSIYEFGAFIIKVFPELYSGLSPTGKDVYFYVRMESIPIMNFFIYFIQTTKTRLMVNKFLGNQSQQSSNLVTVTNRTASGQH